LVEAAVAADHGMVEVVVPEDIELRCQKVLEVQIHPQKLLKP
jgi:hypothetical protein